MSSKKEKPEDDAATEEETNHPTGVTRKEDGCEGREDACICC